MQLGEFERNSISKFVTLVGENIAVPSLRQNVVDVSEGAAIGQNPLLPAQWPPVRFPFF